MRSLNRRFLNFQKKFPDLGNYIVLEKAVRSQWFTKRVIQKSFDMFMTSEDYDKSDRSLLLHFLYQSSIRTEDDTK
jgi:uncharacterized protein YicC (UPF0701 family)